MSKFWQKSRKKLVKYQYQDQRWRQQEIHQIQKGQEEETVGHQSLEFASEWCEWCSKDLRWGGYANGCV